MMSEQAPKIGDRLNILAALLHPAMADLASPLGLTPIELAEWLASPDVAPRIATLTSAAEVLNRLLSLGARAPTLNAARSLVDQGDPADQRRIINTVLRETRPAPTRSRQVALKADTPGDARDHAALPPAPVTRLWRTQSAASSQSALPAPSSPPPRAESRPTPDAARAQPAPVAASGPTAAPALAAPATPALHRRSPEPRAAALLAAAGASPRAP